MNHRLPSIMPLLCALLAGCAVEEPAVGVLQGALTGVEELAEPCAAVPAAPLPGTLCKRLRITCGGVAPADVQLRWTPPAGDPVGTVIFGSGGGGHAWYSNTGVGVMSDLSAAGYTVVERRWEAEKGWFAGPGGVTAVACRYDRLLRYVKKELHQGGGLCATGTSGGSVELGYNLTRYGAGGLLRAAVLASGPLARLDVGCHGADAAPAWPGQCAALLEDHFTCTEPVCQLDDPRKYIDAAHGETPPGLCSTDAPTAAQLTTLRGDSPLGPGATTSFPGTRLRFLYGEDDCTGAPSGGLAFAQQLIAAGNDATTTFVLAAGHSLQEFASGRVALTSALLSTCAP